MTGLVRLLLTICIVSFFASRGGTFTAVGSLRTDDCFGTEAAFNLTLLHTGNTEGRASAINKFNSPCVPLANGTYTTSAAAMPCLGGIARRVSYIQSVRASVQNTLTVDSGLLFGGKCFPASVTPV